jgi:hypothetical protein
MFSGQAPDAGRIYKALRELEESGMVVSAIEPAKLFGDCLQPFFPRFALTVGRRLPIVAQPADLGWHQRLVINPQIIQNHLETLAAISRVNAARSRAASGNHADPHNRNDDDHDNRPASVGLTTTSGFSKNQFQIACSEG